MFYLNLNYEIFESNNTMFFYDVFQQKTVLVISLKNLKFNEIRDYLCFGFNDKDMEHNTKLFEFLLQKHDYLFAVYKNKKIVRYFRLFNTLNKDSFVSFESYIEMVKKQIIILKNNTMFILNSNDISSFINTDKFCQIPFVRVDNDAINCDLKIVTDNCDNDLKKIHIEITEKEIFVGPLNTKNGVEYSSSKTMPTSLGLLNYEENVIVMFVEKISILIYLDLFDKMRFNSFVPFRFRLKYDRITSEIVTDTEVKIYDC